MPIPRVASLAELTELIAAADAPDDARVITGRTLTVTAAFAAERPTLVPLPAEVFDTARLLRPQVDTKTRICVRQRFYSVPAHYVGRRLPTRLGATTVEVLDGARGACCIAGGEDAGRLG